MTLTGDYVRGADTSDDLRERARHVLPTGVFDYIAGGAGEERTVAANRAGFGRYRLLPRVLTDVSSVDITVEILGTRLTAPIFTCPMGGLGLVHPDGEVGVARAAAAVGLGHVLNGHPSIPLEEVAAQSGPARWKQLYWEGNRAVMADLAERAQTAGYQAVVLTVDNAVTPRRPRMIRTGFEFPPEMSTGNFRGYTSPAWQGRVSLDRRGRPVKGGSPDVALTWKNVEWLRTVITVPFVLKGVRTASDAVRAHQAGFDGVIVSNHGGRNVDGEPGTIELLEGIVRAVDGRMVVLLDGGIRSARDIVIALGLGASGVGVGAPIAWALACGGEQVVTDHLSDLIDDLRRTFALVGASRLSELTREHVSRRDEYLPDPPFGMFLAPGYRAGEHAS